MKRDIRELFKGDDAESKSLPKGHREEFYAKLKTSRAQRLKGTYYRDLIKVAASVLLFAAVMFAVIKTSENAPAKLVEGSVIENQIEHLEQQYLVSIDKEWKRFIRVAKDDQLIGRYQRKLEELNERYREITVEFKSDPNNISVLEDLVDNLKTRLKLLKDIQTHIKLINQTNEHHENSI
jgi:hypothetical protein